MFNVADLLMAFVYGIIICLAWQELHRKGGGEE